MAPSAPKANVTVPRAVPKQVDAVPEMVRVGVFVCMCVSGRVCLTRNHAWSARFRRPSLCMRALHTRWLRRSVCEGAWRVVCVREEE